MADLPLLYDAELDVCRTSYRFLTYYVHNSDFVYIGKPKNMLRFKASNIFIENGWKCSCITFISCDVSIWSVESNDKRLKTVKTLLCGARLQRLYICTSVEHCDFTYMTGLVLRLQYSVIC
jgi:hypothetical protein